MKKILLLLVLAIVSNNLFAETGKEAIDACIKSMKSDNFATFKTQKITYSIKMQGQSGELVHYIKGENKHRFEAKSAMGEQVFIKNGDKMLMIKPSEQEIPNSDWESIYEQFTQYEQNPSRFLKNAENSFELVGTEDFNGKSCKKISTTEKVEGIDKIYVYTDAVTNWIAGQKMELSGGQGEATILVSDMKKIKGAVYPSLVKINMGGQEVMSLSVNSWEADIDLDDALFSK